ncbi:uncharacterized protein LOC103846047 [Brassica rapa]|uniref:Uncharacterized protein n=1 Tax=Brassica campestris TaxID=3711 RepID=M4CCP3_BRACM|nr:uncharacterized protein LOC103846047 [Brassica rapa]
MASPPIPNRPNPKPRNSEAGDPLRRSFGGNPFPVNSKVNVPSDVSRRKSFGGRDFSDKENETKAPPTPKGSKNFMSPTISAVSKINPSPRKRVLSDKNQVTRSLSDVKGLTFEEDTKSHHSCVSFSAEKKPFERPHDMTVTDFDEDKGIVYSDPRFRISPRPSVPYSSPEFADREAGPVLPPYDPKMNYLSPRPQFLHYRPNPRVEKQLDELFISQSSSSDTEMSSSAEEQEKDAESDEAVVCESIEETSRVPKQSGFRPFRFLGWFLAMSLGYLLVSATFSGLSILEESPSYEFNLPKGIKEFAEANKLEELSERLWTSTESSLVYVGKMISRLGGRTEEYAPLQFHNLTYTLEEENTVFQPTRVEINGEPLQEKVRGENSLEDDYELEEESGGEQTEMSPSTDIELKEGEENLEAIVIEEPEVILTEVSNGSQGLESQENLGTGSIKTNQVEIEAIYTNQHDVETAAIIKAHQQVESVLADAESGREEGFRDITAETSDGGLYPKLQENEVVANAAESGSENGLGKIAAETSEDVHPEARSFNKAMIVLSSTVMVVLLAAVAFLFTKKEKPVAPEPVELNLAHVPVENLVKEKLTSLNVQAEEEEVDDRISNSVHKKSSSLSNNKDPKEHQSLGGSSKLRRESMASSASEYSVGSFSYGSFTTYEKIPIKSGDGEEEMITPVRRSSRIRKHHQPSSML